MKDTLTNKATEISSCLADCPQASVDPTLEETLNKLTPNDHKSRVRRSAAMIGLAISMSATGMILSQEKAAIAANPSIPSLPTVSHSDIEQGQLAPLALKHKVQPGESLQQLAKEYQVSSESIALTNNLAITADLEPGQTIKIPSVRKSAEKVTGKATVSPNPETDLVATKPINTSLDHLRETRKRLQDSLAELKTEKSQTNVQTNSVVADVSDVSQSLTVPETSSKLTNPSAKTEVAQAIEIPVLGPESEAVSSTSNVPLTIPEIKSPTGNSTPPQPKENVASAGVSRQEDTEPKTPSLSTLPAVPSVRQQTTAKAEQEQPISIPVISPEAQSSQDASETNLQAPQQTSFRQPTAIVPQPQVVVTQKSYQIRPGDTLNSIARRHGISATELIRANGITNPNLIKVHQTLVIPQKTTLANNGARNQSFASSPLSASVNKLPLRGNTAQRSFVTQNQREISVATAQEAYTEKLRSDIVSLQQDYSQQPQSISINVEPYRTEDASQTVVGETVNSEWKNDRRQARKSPQEILGQRSDQEKPQLISTAPTDPGFYNDAFQIPVGTNVGPELPGLSNPDDYLPGAPTKFTGYIWPSKGVITSGFGRRWGRMHKGLDIAAPVGTPIMAAAPGEVVYAGWNSGGYGNLVKVRHPDGSITLYAHNSRILVRRGQQVDQGQQISEMGSTGYSTGPHLHFEIHPNGKAAQNPIAFLPKSRS
ncbi:peptidoglycan DD-metalloendopeptidase family protein [Crocosphaera sp. XPORK-15E]|uniref:peptidoglycan DD-metalloendopeptidase family protein n=1 Tax=Crocosphaera sp. XPORK-15E TaxID=3110247 RepID=UPI002B208278|nr:peptidoglycan DD-metalloendopeptidase family protein [Crocosphaera sp. XPORK-15E]MEA5534199.1 peptidoglycan DD-metalloendopeptidase family protein [Crocosphaera sp. XPORK-15E]